MKPRRIRFTSTAQRHVRQLLPAAGTVYPRVRIAGLRRMYVSQVACHLYDTFDDDQVIWPCGALADFAVRGSGANRLSRIPYPVDEPLQTLLGDFHFSRRLCPERGKEA